MMRLFLIVLMLLPASTVAAPLVADISSHQIEIHSGFTGTQLLLFGARNDPGDIVVVLRGPEHDFLVRRKERVAGIWVNRKQTRFDRQPQFYAVAASRSLDQIRQFNLFSPLNILRLDTEQQDPFLRAMQRILTEQELYQQQTATVDFIGETLFKTTFSFPDNMPRGTYTAETYLFSDGLLAGMQSIPINVHKTGFDAFVFDAAENHSFFYGVSAVLLALGIGWLASWLFHRI